MQLFNSLSRKIENFNPINAQDVRIYSCGPTVYSYAHIGNMRAFLFADLLQRTLRTVEKYNIRWIMNVTNIDDKTIRDSKIGSSAWNDEMGKQTGDPMTDLSLLTEFYRKEFINDIVSLGIDETHFFAMPKATDYIPQMQSLIRNIIDGGYAYISNGSIYFNVAAYSEHEKYGKLFKIDKDNFKAGLRVDTDQYDRENVSDFVIWKEHKEGEPFWDFEIDGQNYPGRPGWHIECSAMEAELLGLPFDIHTGGIDLKFPHHEDEIAQSKAGYGIEPTKYWCHNEFLEVEGAKMSKSLGNFFTIRDLVKQDIEPIDIRYAMLSVHYRTKYNFTTNGIFAARKARLRLQEYIDEILKLENKEDKVTETEKIKSLRDSVFMELASDLHTPKALAHLFGFINHNAVTLLSPPEQTDFIHFMRELNDIFVAWRFELTEEKKSDIPANIMALAEQRLQAKKDKNYSEADRLRNEIDTAGYNIKDTKDGFEITAKV